MPNLKVGDTVFHKGVKRKITFFREFAGVHFLHLAGFPYMVRYGAVKPVIRLSARLGG